MDRARSGLICAALLAALLLSPFAVAEGESHFCDDPFPEDFVCADVGSDGYVTYVCAGQDFLGYECIAYCHSACDLGCEMQYGQICWYRPRS